MPLSAVPLLILYHLVGLWAGIASGFLHLAIVVAGLHVNGIHSLRFRGSGWNVGPGLLVLGGALVWMVGEAGPPDPSNVVNSQYNQAGLTLSFFVTLIGVAATAPIFGLLGEGVLASVGLVCFAAMVVLWTVDSFLVQALLLSPFIGLPDAARPDWFQMLVLVYRLLGGAGALPVGYVVSALLAAILGRVGWTSRPLAGLLTVLSLLCVLGGIFALVTGRGGALVPPAFMCLLPYYVGVIAVVRLGKNWPIGNGSAPTGE